MATGCASSLGGGQLLPAVAGICSPAGLPPARARLERCRERALEPGPHPAGPRHRAWPPGARHRSPALTRPARLGGRGAGQALLSGLAASPVLSMGPCIQPQGGERGHPRAPRHLSRPEHLASSGSRWGPGGPGLGVGGAGPGPGETERAPPPDTPTPTALLGFMPHPSDPPAHPFPLVFETCLRWLCFSWGQNLRWERPAPTSRRFPLGKAESQVTAPPWGSGPSPPAELCAAWRRPPALVAPDGPPRQAPAEPLPAAHPTGSRVMQRGSRPLGHCRWPEPHRGAEPSLTREARMLLAAPSGGPRGARPRAARAAALAVPVTAGR